MLLSIIREPFIALGFSIALGSWIGKKVKYKTFNLGLIAGSLFISVIIGQVGGFDIPKEVGNILFGLFIFGIGIEAGSTFFQSLNKKTLALLTVTLVTSIAGLLLVVLTAYIFKLDKGLAAGLAAGALTQSSIIGAASDTLAKLGLSVEATKTLQLNVVVGYSMTYIMGSFLPILLTTGIIPLLKKWNLRESAVYLAQEQAKGQALLEDGQFEALNIFSTRTFKINPGSSLIGKKAHDLFTDRRPRIAVESINRNWSPLVITLETKLLANDIVAITAHTDSFKQIVKEVGEEVAKPENMLLVEEYRSVILKNPKYHKLSIAEIDPDKLCNVFIQKVRRYSEHLRVDRNLKLHRNDELVLMGNPRDLDRATKELGARLPVSSATDYTSFGFFLALGFLIGLISFKLFGASITLGSGIGCLASGILMGYFHTRNPQYAKVPLSTTKFLKDFGLAGFVAIIGLNAGSSAVVTIMEHGATIFVLGLFVSTLPMIAAYLWMVYVLKIKNPINIVSTLNAARSSNPGFASVLDAAGNATPVQYFTPCYTLAQITQTLLGVLIVAIVPFVV